MRGENEASRLSDRCAAGEGDVTPTQVTEKVGELLPSNEALPLEDVAVVVEGLLAGMREAP